MRALAEVFPKAPQLCKWPGNNPVGNFASVHIDNPAATGTLLTTLEGDTHSRNRPSACELLARKASEPRVRYALRKAVSSDPGARMRDYWRRCWSGVM